MTQLLGASLSFVSWSHYKIQRPITTRSGKLPGQRAERPLTPVKLTDWLDDLERRACSLVFDDGAFTLYWPSVESYSFRDVERVRVNWGALLTHFKLRKNQTPEFGIPLTTLLADLPLVFLDTETTGLSAEDRVIELYLTHAGISFYSRFDPDGRPSNPRAFEVHRIPDEDLIGEPLFRERMDEILDHLDGAALVAHNAAFDVRMLTQEFTLAGVEWAPCAVLDTKKLAKRVLPQLSSHRLVELADHYGIAHLADHTAAGDVETLQAVFRELTRAMSPMTTLKDLI